MIRLSVICAAVEAALAVLLVRRWLHREYALQRTPDIDHNHVRGQRSTSPQASHAAEIGQCLHNLRNSR